MNYIFKKEKDKYKALAVYRSTPLQNGYSHAEKQMGRKLRTIVPAFHMQLQPKYPDFDKLNKAETTYGQNQKMYYIARYHIKPLTPLFPGQDVKSKNHMQPGVVAENSQKLKKYAIATPTSEIKHRGPDYTIITCNNSQRIRSKRK